MLMSTIYFLLPEISLLFFILFGLSIAAISTKLSIIEKKERINPLIIKITLIALFFTTAIITVQLFYNFKCKFHDDSIRIFSTFAYICFNGYIIVDTYTSVLKISILITTAIILICSKSYFQNHIRSLLEFPILILLVILCLFILLSSYNLIVMFIAIIGFSLNIYVLLMSDFKNKAAREAAVKYYYLSTLSSGLLISGILLAYLIFHSTNFAIITWLLHCWSLTQKIELTYVLLTFMLYFIIFGFLFKLAAFPCHLWTPEVYDGAPNPITAIFILPIKIATFGIFLRLLGYVFIDLHFIWNYLVLISSILSMTWGGLAAIIEFQLKRFIAYSSINQMGFLLIGIVCGSFEGIQASLFYLYIYVLMNLGFLIFFLTAHHKKYKHSLIYITDLRYIVHIDYKMTAFLVIMLFSMAGIPPLGGFFGKFFLFLAAYKKGYASLIFIGLLTSLISTYYYLRLIKILWFSEPQPIINKTKKIIHKKQNIFSQPVNGDKKIIFIEAENTDPDDIYPNYQFYYNRFILIINTLITLNIITFIFFLSDLTTVSSLLTEICLNPLDINYTLFDEPEDRPEFEYI